VIRFVCLCLALLFFSPEPCEAGVKPATLLYNATTGETLHSYRADAPHPPASLTKVMTTFLVFDALAEGRLNWDTPVDVPLEATQLQNVKIGYAHGECVRLKDVLYAAIVCSANDAAAALAHHVAGSEEAFIRRMNEKAQALGMTQTKFYNPHGLPHPQQTSSARDLLTLSMALIDAHPEYYSMFSTPHYSYKNRKFKNTNKFLYDGSGVDGIKTGFVNASKYNIIVSRVVNGERLIAVVLGEPTSIHRSAKVTKLLGVKPRVSSTAPKAVGLQKTAKVQVGAFKSRSLAEKYAKQLQRAYGKEVKPLKRYHIYKKNGTYKLLFGPIKSGRAVDTCHKLKQRNVECFVLDRS